MKHEVFAISLSAFGHVARPASCLGEPDESSLPPAAEAPLAACTAQPAAPPVRKSDQSIRDPNIDFIAGPENRLAAAAVNWLLEPGQHSYLPLVLHGPSGSGKSHLAQGIAQAQGKAVLTNGADFARELADAIDKGTVARWRTKYRQADFLVFEDLTQIADRRAAQQEILHTLDELEVRQVPVVITSRLAPKEIAELPPTLRSRLAAGLEVPLSPPGEAARAIILERLAAKRGIRFTPSALKLLAEGLCLCVIELRGALAELQLDAIAPLDETAPIDAKQVRRYLAARRNRLRPSLKHLTSLVAKYFGLKSSHLCGPSRRRQVAFSRNVAIYLGRQLTGKSLQALGRHFGNRDHTTVLHSYRLMEARLSDDAEMRRTVMNLRRMLVSC